MPMNNRRLKTRKVGYKGVPILMERGRNGRALGSVAIAREYGCTYGHFRRVLKGERKSSHLIRWLKKFHPEALPIHNEKKGQL